MNKYNNQYFILSSSCALTKGASRTLIQDFQRSNADFIPNDYYSLCNLLNRHKISDIANEIEDDSLADYYQFVDFMIEREYAFVSDNLQSFPEISKESYEDEDHIYDAIIEIDENDVKTEKLEMFLTDLKKLHCTDLQVRIYNHSDMARLHQLLKRICNHIFYYVELHLDSSGCITFENCCDLILNYAPITNIYLYDSSSNTSQDYNENTEGCYPLKMGTVYYVAAELNNNNCGCISDYSKIYRDSGFYKMSQLHNSCLYKKVSLDRDGYVRNCPSMFEKYNLSEGLEMITKSPTFRKYWNITKKDVEGCKDCEFRFNCLDCRAHTKGNGMFNKPITCKYNPFIVKTEQ